LKAYSAGYAVQSKKIHGKQNLRNQKGRKFSHSATSRNYDSICNKLYIPCSIFESTMAANYGISQIPSAAKALTQTISKYT